MTHRGFVVELNNPDRYKENLLALLKDEKFECDFLDHKTTIHVKAICGSSNVIKVAKLISKVLNKSKSSAIIFSLVSGRMIIINYFNDKEFEITFDSKKDII